jgi:NAD+ diphosphatase
MLGFRAVAHSHDISLRDGELEDARWFTRAEIAAGHPTLPPSGSISARLINAWFGEAGAPPDRG